MSTKQLTRSREKKLMGVAGGIAEYLDMDPTVWRAIWVFAAIMMPPLVVAYIVLGLVVPDSAAPAAPWQPVDPPWPAAAGPQPPVTPVAPAPAAPTGEAPVPVLDEARVQEPVQQEAPNQGQAQYQGQTQYQSPNQTQFQGEPINNRDAYRPLTKSRDRWISGVCGGIAHYFGIDPVIIRAVWLASIFFFGTGIFLYIVLAILMPNPVDQTRF